MNLAQLQDGFQTYLLDESAKHPFFEYVIDDAKVGAHKRLGIYHHAYRSRLIDVLATVYPNLNKWLGTQRFVQIVHGFIGVYPSSYRNMRWVGAEMAQYLRQTVPQQPLLADMAEFEWALGLAFDAEDIPPMQLTDISEVPPEEWGELRFSLHPSLNFKQASVDVIAIWQALESGKKPAKKTPKSVRKAIAYLVWRQDYASYFKKIDSTETRAIQSIQAGDTFGELCAKLAIIIGEESATQAAANYLVQWLNAQILIPYTPS